MTREETVLHFLRAHDIPFEHYSHPEGKTIEEAKRWWKDDGSVHCKNLQQEETLSFHPNDCRGTVVIGRDDFERYLECVGNSYEYISLYEDEE